MNKTQPSLFALPDVVNEASVAAPGVHEEEPLVLVHDERMRAGQDLAVKEAVGGIGLN